MTESVKVRIDLGAGSVEIEAQPSDFQTVVSQCKELIAELAVAYLSDSSVVEEQVDQSEESQTEPTQDSGKSEPTKGRGTNKRQRGQQSRKKAEEARLVNVDLKPEGKISFREFYQQKSPVTQMEKYTVIVYYLQKIAGENGITPDHVYTALKSVNQPVSKALRTTLSNTASRKGWIDTSNYSDIKVTILGENLVEHELPRGKKGKPAA